MFLEIFGLGLKSETVSGNQYQNVTMENKNNGILLNIICTEWWDLCETWLPEWFASYRKKKGKKVFKKPSKLKMFSPIGSEFSF